MALQDYHWDKFYLHMYYHTDIDTVFNSWTTSEGQASFFVMTCSVTRDGSILGPKEIFQMNDKYEYLWEEGSRSRGRILMVDKKNYKFEFSFAGARVRVKLENRKEGVLLELKHYDIPKDLQEEQQLDCRSGWTHFLINLKCVLEKGVDIREKDPKCGGTLGWGIYPPEGLILD